jgi:hypothetical protein
MRWVGHIVCMGGMTNAFKILVQNLKKKDHSDDLGMDSRKILNTHIFLKTTTLLLFLDSLFQKQRQM